MAKEICISSTPHETRLAILEDDQLAEIYYERENEYTLAGSVYKGRVTRVLPGMQSAFVDIGLERDAFLYVTDFLEMEDQEDTDEVERAASQGNARPAIAPQAQQGPRSLRGEDRSNDRSSDRGNDRGNRESQGDRGRRGEIRLPAAEVTPAESQSFFIEGGDDFEPAPSPAPVSSIEPAQEEETDEQGARRWRGRRRRRGGRGPGASSESGEESQHPGPGGAGQEESPEESAIPALDFEASASTPAAPPAKAEPRQQASVPASATPFVLPGESLSKYGAPPPEKPSPSRLVLTELPPDTSPALPQLTVAKPSTLVETEFVWDGKGLLPGESIARHRREVTAPEPKAFDEPEGVFVSPKPVSPAPASLKLASPVVPETEDIAVFESGSELEGEDEDEFEAESELEEASALEREAELESEFEDEFAPGSAPQPGHALESEPGNPIAAAHPELADESEEFDEFEEEESAAFSDDDPMTELEEPAASEIHASEAHPSVEIDSEAAAKAGEDPEPTTGASASHNVDPLPPSSFRLKDLFGGKKREDSAATETPSVVPAPTPASPLSVKASAVSTYKPGDGPVEEEVIEEEEYEFAPLKAHHGGDHDSDELEEETLQQQIRSGALGEMLQEAHLDHRILIESEDYEESDPDEDQEGASTAATGRPAAPGGRPDRQEGRGGRDSRGGRGRSDGRSDGRGDGRSDGRGGRDNRRGQSGGQSRRSAQTSDLPIISDLLKPGQEILVQIAKEPIAKKGARITSHIALPGRFLVFMPTVSHVGVSRKIASDEERQRLKRILVSEKGEASGGFIVRTAADGASEDELRSDLRFLINLWNDIKQRADTSRPPALIYHDLSLIERILRDQVSDNFSHIWVDSEADYERIVRFLNRFSPELVRRVKLYTKEVPLFEHFGIQEEISKALRSKVWLKSGGSIVINQTEALVAIDINTGKFVGKTARLEDTILKTNLDAIPEIVRQIRLRDLGGIIVIDFIDMDERKNRTRVMAALEEALKQDRAPTKVLQFNDFGLVAITRKRVKQSLERTLSVPCPVCQATGMVKSPATVANEIYIEMRKMRKHFDQSEVLLRVHPETAKALKGNNARWLTELEELVGKNVLIKNDATLHPEQFDIQG